MAYRGCGTLTVGLDRGDLAEVDDLLSLQHRLGLRAERLTSRECSRAEPMLATVAGGVLVPDDHQVDPRRLVAALLAAALSGPAFAHTHLKAAVPADGSTVKAAPATFALTFSEPARLTALTGWTPLRGEDAELE